MFYNIIFENGDTLPFIMVKNVSLIIIINKGLYEGCLTYYYNKQSVT